MPVIDFEVRKECPPNLCDCRREQLLHDAQACRDVLRLNLTEEKKLLAHIEAISSYAQLQKLGLQLQKNLGVVLRIEAGSNEVRTVRGFQIALDEQPGLCRKTRASIPAAIRRCLAAHPEIAYAILNENDLLAGA
ncbi:hypothetical protein [Janthinobacterium aquaticum]|uniref:hypothetical protein n=1 Tax=Janthinobacterium sp. FT58W TaxID=2654254 RepID=UPI001263E8DD|nr:hypothetical protein [Janthinobacterium sp. FT58W]KAB8044267.1 hypothetical protein GCM43_03385 [Janthinobacterium sp. FT58W]